MSARGSKTEVLLEMYNPVETGALHERAGGYTFPRIPASVGGQSTNRVEALNTNH